ncbi:MAG: DNA recombination protein RmuC [Oscillospiraceae bacterium]|nr:DNA recombination protein RmuC [Oscillospiraceae bacterium]
MDTAAIILSAAALAVSITAFTIIYIRLLKIKSDSAGSEDIRRLMIRFEESDRRSGDELSRLKQETSGAYQTAMNGFAATLSESQRAVFSAQEKRIEDMRVSLTQSQIALRAAVTESIASLDERSAQLRRSLEQNSEELRRSLETTSEKQRAENAKSLSEIRSTVDEKLQTVLEERLSRSFKDVSERLEQVYRGLGEMQTLANGVGDLKKVLSNVKTRGILGEIQLGAILEQILSPEQYVLNAEIVKNRRVEFAVKLPGAENGAPVLLPIDSKFPTDAYQRLLDAYETGSPEAVESARAVLERRIKDFAKEIRDKYICPPATTDFAIMFLPTEGLYAEVVRMGMIETLQNEFRVNIAGPTTTAALLNSLQMGFKTLAIQKRSSEVWETLGAVKTEFGKFEQVLQSVSTRIEAAHDDLDKLITTRTRAINRRLRDVSALESEESAKLIDE